MATASAPGNLTLEEFERQYGGLKPYYEYWFGSAVQKSMPTFQHALLQKILVRLLDQLGYVAAPELTLKIGREFQPVPDVVALRRPIDQPYPTKPVEIVVEILSPEDAFPKVMKKARLYAEMGIKHIWVIDPIEREGWQWNHARSCFDPVERVGAFSGDGEIRLSLSEIFSAVDKELKQE